MLWESTLLDLDALGVYIAGSGLTVFDSQGSVALRPKSWTFRGLPFWQATCPAAQPSCPA